MFITRRFRLHSPPTLNRATSRRARSDRTFFALSDRTRRGILERLGRGPATISELAEPFAALRAWAAEHGRPPTMRDWPAADRKRRRPTAATVQEAFGSWSTGLAAAAGLQAQKSGGERWERCKRGHGLAGDNVVVDRRGKRCCLTSRRAREQERQRRKRQASQRAAGPPAGGRPASGRQHRQLPVLKRGKPRAEATLRF